MKTILIICFIATLISCGKDIKQGTNAGPKACFDKPAGIIFGNNDIYSITKDSADHEQVIANSVAAMVHESRLINRPKLNGKDNYDKVLMLSGKLKDHYPMCDRYLNESRVAAKCSAFLVAPDILATAGHCIQNKRRNAKSSCRNYKWVFDFRNDSFAYKTYQTLLGKNQVYRCDHIIKYENSKHGDYALVKLDRPVVGRKAVPMLNSAELKYGNALATIGFPLGQTMKVSRNGKYITRTSTNDWFFGQIDTFSGNSGGPVIDLESKMVIGIHTAAPRGALKYNNSRKCFQLKKCYSSRSCGMTKAFNLASIPEIADEIKASYNANRIASKCN